MKWAKPRASIRGIIVSELHLTWFHVPFFGMIPNKSAQQVAEKVVDDFSLPINLGMIGATEIKASMNHLSQTTLKVTEESCIPVRGNGSREAVDAVDVPKEELGYINSIHRLLAGNEMSHL